MQLQVLRQPLFESAVKNPSVLAFQIRYWLLLPIPVKLSKFQCGIGITVRLCRLFIIQIVSLVLHRLIYPLCPVAAILINKSENLPWKS